MPERVPPWLRMTVSLVVALVVGYLFLTDSSGDTADQTASTTSEFVDPDQEILAGPGDSGSGVGDDSNDSDSGSGDEANTSDDNDSRDSIGVSGLPAAFTDGLPNEALDVIDAIQNGDQLPYRQDGSTFQNREGLLPFESQGYYREYTVETPGSSDRGARRIVTGDRGEVFYTADHYDSFVEVVDARV